MKAKDRKLGAARRYLRPVLAGSLAVASIFPVMAFQDEGTVRIGLLESQTGVLAPYGIPGLLGSQIAIEEINNAGGITVAGKKVKLAPVPDMKGHDPANDPAQAIALVITGFDNSVSAHRCMGSNIEIAPL